ncbi:MAG: hypothetical protein ACREMQ_07250, partial [Longimicrobiales bacterium]
MDLVAESTGVDRGARETAEGEVVSPSQSGTRTTNRLKASIVDLTFLIWAVAAPVAFSGRMLNSDGDLARHIAMGEHMLRFGRIERDVFSFTKAGETFVAYEWLSQVLYALFHRLGGVAGVAI